MLDSKMMLFIGFAAILTLTPGADTLLVIRSVIGRGQRAGIITTVGICCGLFFHAILSAAGLSAILVKSATAFETLKLVGAFYLIFLGAISLWKLWRSYNTPPAPQVAMRGAGDAPAWKIFAEGLLNNILNPKAAIFYLAFLPQFINPGDPVFAKSILLAGIHFVMGIVWLSLLTIFLGKMKGMFTGSRLSRWLEATSGTLLIALGIRLALEQR